MKISFVLLASLSFIDASAKKVYDAYRRMCHRHHVNVTWANDGIGYLIFVHPKATPAEEAFFGPNDSLLA